VNRRSTQLILAATAFAAPALLAACGTESADAGSVTPSSTAPVSASVSTPATPAAGGLTVANLLTDDDTVYSPGAADWFRLGTGREALDGQGDLAHPCLAEGLTGLGATEVVRADFELRNLEAGAPEVTGDHLTQLVAEFGSEAKAIEAWSIVNRMVQECEERPDAITDYRSLQTRKVAVPGADAVISDSHYGPVPKELDPQGEAAYIMETGALQSGSRLTVITSVIVGQDYNFLEEEGGTPVQQMLAPAAKRLHG
jgi:hypothetical protein